MRIADGIAYINHDRDDAVRAGLVPRDDLPRERRRSLGATHAERIDTLVRNVIAHSDNCQPGANGICPRSRCGR